MQGNQATINLLNDLLIKELAMINQYLIQAEFVKNNGYKKLYKYFAEKKEDERDHAHLLMRRILELEGVPIVDKIGEVLIGIDLPTQLVNDTIKEDEAIRDYNNAIELMTCCDHSDKIDFETARILEKILNDEVEHLHEIEMTQTQIKDMTLGAFLSTQIKK